LQPPERTRANPPAARVTASAAKRLRRVRIIDGSGISWERAYFGAAICAWYAAIGIFEYPWSLLALNVLVYVGLRHFCAAEMADDRARKTLQWDAERSRL
jgi:hypothetical protein